MKKKSINSIRKGKAHERACVNCFKKLGYFARRTQQYSGIPNSFGEKGISDIIVDAFPHIHFECKKIKKLPSFENLETLANKWIEQCLRDTAINKKTPYILFQENNGTLFVGLLIEDEMSEEFKLNKKGTFYCYIKIKRGYFFIRKFFDVFNKEEK